MTPDETRATLSALYDAMARRDGAAMAALYADDATFDDPVFSLRGAEIGAMWTGLLRRAKEFSVSYTIAQAGSGKGVVEWTARYLFAGKNPVVNVILSELTLEGGKITRQKDTFDFPRWAAQALGTPGKLLGRFGWFQRSVARKARRGLGLTAG